MRDRSFEKGVEGQKEVTSFAGVKNQCADTTALYVKNDSESELSLNENDLPQHIPRFVNPEPMLGETLGNAHKPAESLGVFHEKVVLQSHMDAVRDAQFSCNLNYLVTVSEDCMVKLWDVKALKKNSLPHPTRIEPCFSYRGHTGPLFSVCVGSGLQPNSHFFYTAGSEGIIRIWAVPSVDGSKFPCTNGKNFCVGLWTSHRDVVWQLVHHPLEGLLLSVSADGTVKMWKEFDISEAVDGIDKSTSLFQIDSNDCLLGAFVYKSASKQSYEVPTSATWAANMRNEILISYANSFLGLFDRVTVLLCNPPLGKEQRSGSCRPVCEFGLSWAAG
eukprot:TRINITY_DN340_c0_g1_i20.p1 TRINITY_DN340_c0_g1~~TRINITY_DN340_c0_g1_i20.p1  ORF type:complete len:332 (-),score=47.71 TRINITY_DN340_c0_g1_i20:453-1448(-)